VGEVCIQDFGRKTEGKTTLGDLVVGGIYKMDHREIGWRMWT
jgi:hypothetical protein